MGDALVEVSNLKLLIKAAKAFSDGKSFDAMWLRVGDGKLEFRAKTTPMYAIIGMTIPCETRGESRSIGISGESLSDYIKTAKGAIAIHWNDLGAKNSGVVSFKSGGRRRSMVMLSSEEVEVKTVPDVPSVVSATLALDDLRDYLSDAASVGEGYVKLSNIDGHLTMLAKGSVGGEEAEWDAALCQGEPGKIGHWSAENWLPLLPPKTDDKTIAIRFHPNALRFDWTIDGQPCAVAVSSLENVEE